MIRMADGFLNHITMYRLVLYYLLGLLLASFGLGLVSAGPAAPLDLLLSAIIVTGVCWTVNRAAAALLRVPLNSESVYITALILVLIMPPASFGVLGLACASVVAIISKFLLAYRGRHIFNPVAIGVVASAALLDQPATWWVGGNLPLLPAVLLGGLLVLRKVQRFGMFAAYALANVIVSLIAVPADQLADTLQQTLIYSPLLFAGFAMLTEPLTAPHTRWPGLAFGAVIGALSSPAVHIGDFYLTPEIAFLAGNALAFAANPSGRFKFTLLRIEELAAGCYDYVFRPNRPLSFKAGQYLDWTMHVPAPDARGNRRPFTIASAPTEGEVHIGVKFYKDPSAFKQTLLAMRPGDVIFGSQLAGDFTLPRDHSEKLAFIAGGIGVTPFRSMVQEMLDKRSDRPVVMLYGNNSLREIAYSDVFSRAEREIGMKTIYAVAEGNNRYSNVRSGYVDAAMIRREIPDYQDRTFYISGPRAMVVNFERVLRDLGISRRRIKVDFFPGFA